MLLPLTFMYLHIKWSSKSAFAKIRIEKLEPFLHSGCNETRFSFLVTAFAKKETLRSSGKRC
jgi:hypothetical protein